MVAVKGRVNAFWSLTACDNLVERGLKKQMLQNRASILTDGSLHVALDAKTINLAAKVLSEVNQPALSKIFTDITDYHLTPVQAAEIARKAGVKKLVVYHVVPPLTNFILKRRYLKGVDDVYGGAVEIGEDGMTFKLEPKPG